MFARSQTFVCLQANSCLTTGKHAKMASIAPHNMLLGSSMDALFSLNRRQKHPNRFAVLCNIFISLKKNLQKN